MSPCVGSWASPAGNTPKYWFNFSNPALADWWVKTYIGEVVSNPLFDGVYFDCCCGKAPGVPPGDSAQFAADAQATFDRALKLIADASKWASAWNSDGAISALQNHSTHTHMHTHMHTFDFVHFCTHEHFNPPSLSLSLSSQTAGRGHCATTMRAWMQKGANDSLSLQPLALAFRTKQKRGHVLPAPPATPAPPVQCGDSCSISQGYDTENTGIVASPVEMPNQKNFTDPTNVAECCSRCKANTKCEVFELGPGGCDGTSKNCTEATINCFLIGGFKGVLRPSPTRATGCVRPGKHPAPSPSPPDSVGMEQNNTVAAFMIARGLSGMLELPVGGAYEKMDMYDVDAPILQADWGAALGLGKEGPTGTFTREFEKATIALDCNSYTSSFKPRLD